MEISLLAEALASTEVYVSNRCVARKPREGAGPLPALLLDRGQLPPTTPVFPWTSERRREWFGDVTIALEDVGGDTPSIGPVADRAALHLHSANRVKPQ